MTKNRLQYDHIKNLKVSNEVYPYLMVQKGEINHIEDREEFVREYNVRLQQMLFKMLPHIPANIKSSLDIGSGMGGINILLQQHFKQRVYLLDAFDTPAMCLKHDIPFNSFHVSTEFFRDNNAEISYYIDANFTDLGERVVKSDLIISVGSYCFHYSPEKYLEFVKACCHKDTVLIFDVRNRHTDWLEILRENFVEVAVITEEEKFTKRVFHCKKD